MTISRLPREAADRSFMRDMVAIPPLDTFSPTNTAVCPSEASVPTKALDDEEGSHFEKSVSWTATLLNPQLKHGLKEANQPVKFFSKSLPRTLRFLFYLSI